MCRRVTSTITAALDGVTAQVVLTVTPVLRSLVVTPGGPTVPMGESEGFTATGTFADNSTENLTTDVTWASANTATATISNAAGSTGLASALAIGTSSVSATFEGVTSSTSLTVSPAVLTSISVSPANPTVIQGQTDQFIASGIYSDKSTQDLTGLVTWSSATGSVATVSSTGLASGIAQGKSTISASYQGITGSAPLAGEPTACHIDQRRTDRHKAEGNEGCRHLQRQPPRRLAKERKLYSFVVAGKKGVFTAAKGTVIRVGKCNTPMPAQTRWSSPR